MRLLALVDLESGHVEVLDHALGQLLARIVGNVLLQDPAQQIGDVG